MLIIMTTIRRKRIFKLVHVASQNFYLNQQHPGKKVYSDVSCNDGITLHATV